jgi:hypothetical protein
MNTGNSVPACASSRDFRRSIQSRLAYQSSSLGSASTSVDSSTRRRSSRRVVQRRITRRKPTRRLGEILYSTVSESLSVISAAVLTPALAGTSA